MNIWRMLIPLLIGMVSSCIIGDYGNRTIECDKKDRGLNSFLWTIHRSSPLPPSYLFGTIHVPYDRVWQFIPNNSKEAFLSSDSPIFELDLTNPYTLRALAECQMLPPGQTLSELIPRDLYSRLQRHLDYVRLNMNDWMSEEQKKKGLFADYLFSAIAGNWRRKRPVWVMLMVNSLTELDIKSRGIPVLDLYLAQQAARDGKVTGAVERVEEQCVPLNQLNLSQVLFALNQTLSQHEGSRSYQKSCTTHSLIQHYNCGNLSSLLLSRDATQVPALTDTLTNTSLPPQELHTAQLIEQYFQSELIDKRNERMAQRVSHLLHQHPETSFFFAFGAGHFMGVANVIDRLREAGLTVEHTGPTDTVTLPSNLSRRGRKWRKSLDFPQPSDVIYGDVDYFFRRKIRHNKRYKKERRKKLKAKKRQEKLDSLWESIDPNNFYLGLSKEAETKKQKKNANFNDLWVRSDPSGSEASYLHQANERRFIQGGVATDLSKPRLHPPLSGSSSANHGRNLMALLLCAIYALTIH